MVNANNVTVSFLEITKDPWCFRITVKSEKSVINDADEGRGEQSLSFRHVVLHVTYCSNRRCGVYVWSYVS